MTNTSLCQHGLSKSCIAAFEQCPKRLWLSVHRPGLAEYHDNTARYDTGHLVGEVARGLHAAGVMIEPKPDTAAALAETARLVRDGHPGPLFGATFQHEGVVVRVDILSRDERDGPGEESWILAEVKSSASAKAYHLGGMATQVWAVEGAGLRVGGAAVRHVDSRFVLKREGDYAGLFNDDEQLRSMRLTVSGQSALAADARAVLVGDEPVREPGRHCRDPFACQFTTYCSQGLPQAPEWPVTILPNGAWRKWAKKGIADLLDLDETSMAKPRERMIVAATRSGEPFHDREGALAAMSAWSYPRAWLDFETISAAVPRWVGTRPYQQIPFQFSLHLEQADGTMTHHEFLCCDGSDPRTACALALVDAVPPGATVIAYNAGFERSVLRSLAEHAPQHAVALLTMAENTVDLLPVVRAHWYHRDQRGSWSIKAVLPTIADLDYASLEVKDGGMAQDTFLEAVDPRTSSARRWALEEALRAYCMRDTWAMVLVARRLAAKG